MRYLFSLGFFLAFGFFMGQNVGIQTTTPQLTLEVTGQATDATIVDGLIAPRLSLAELNAKAGLYGSNQAGVIVYINNIAGATVTSTTLINSIGYYYFDGTIWRPLDVKTGNTIFNATSTVNQTVTMNAFNTINLNNVLKNIGGGVWDGSNTYTIPYSGTYLIKSSLRLVDGSASRNIFQAVNTSNQDIPEGVWQTNPSGTNVRWTMPYTRIAYFNQGATIRLYTYSDGTNAVLSNASLYIILLSTN